MRINVKKLFNVCSLKFLCDCRSVFIAVNKTQFHSSSNYLLFNMPPKRKLAVTKKEEKVQDIEQSGAAENTELPAKKKPTKSRAKKEKGPVQDIEDSEAGGDTAKKEPKRSRAKKVQGDIQDIGDSDADEDTALPAKKVSKRSHAKKEQGDVQDIGDTALPAKKETKSSRAKKVKEADAPADELEVVEKTVKRSGRVKTATNDDLPVPKNMNKTSSSWEDIDFTCSKKNEECEAYNLKISSWNVSGLKGWIKKECLQFLEYEKPDILCLQETKCNETKLPAEIKELKDYEQYWCSSTKEGYAGVGLLSKIKPLSVSFGIEDAEMDSDGRCITAEYKDYYVVCVYVPNAGRGLITLPKKLKWNESFKQFINKLNDKKPVIICGDMNVAHQEIDLARPKTNTKNAGFTPEEREGLTDFLLEGYVDTFRALYPDKTDTYTFWTYLANARANNVGWRLDYFIVSEVLMKKICDNVMRTKVAGSDHCPITLFLNV